MRKIPLTQGKFTLVDDEDFGWLNQWKWFVRFEHQHWYAIRSRKPPIRMSRLILGLSENDEQVADHIDHNTLNNCRKNLRVCSMTENAQNRCKRQDQTTSGFKGVSWNNHIKRWVARIMVKGKRVHLGTFTNEGLAARMYDMAAKYFFGAFAKINLEDIS